MNKAKMHPDLESFIRKHCIEKPDARASVRELFERFRESLGPKAAKAWPRWRVIQELGYAGYPVGQDSCRVAYVGGLTFQRERRWVRCSDGRLRLVVEETTVPTSTGDGWRMP